MIDVKCRELFGGTIVGKIKDAAAAEAANERGTQQQERRMKGARTRAHVESRWSNCHGWWRNEIITAVCRRAAQGARALWKCKIT